MKASEDTIHQTIRVGYSRKYFGSNQIHVLFHKPYYLLSPYKTQTEYVNKGVQ